ncbi:MAG: signal peptidase I [Candidatus Wallbacteria bacterium]|nr:signal peptidase I [Candidatus Wallbacteria bacterium]
MISGLIKRIISIFNELPGDLAGKLVMRLLTNKIETPAYRKKKDRIAFWVGSAFNFSFAPLVFVLILNAFVVQAYYVPSGSMENTLLIGDRLFGNKLAFVTEPPARGDIVIFISPVDGNYWVKRLIGLPGETISAEKGKVYINSEPLDEPYLKEYMFGSVSRRQIPENSYFVMGDNRNNSSDCRFWGYLPAKNLRGKALLRYWPLSRMCMLNEDRVY